MKCNIYRVVSIVMVGRDGGKAKPLKQPKKAEKVVLDEDIEFKKKMVCGE